MLNCYRATANMCLSHAPDAAKIVVNELID